MDIEKKAIQMRLKLVEKNPSLLPKANKDKILAQIKNGMRERYNKKPCTVEELMAEADQFAPTIWTVYGRIGITRELVVAFAEELINGTAEKRE
jgi:hypothetical protein